MQCKKHAKEMKTAAAALETLELKSVGPWDSDSKQNQEALETEKYLTHELFSTTSKQYNEAVGATSWLEMSATCRRHAKMSPIFAPACQFQGHVFLVSEQFYVVIFPTLTYHKQTI